MAKPTCNLVTLAAGDPLTAADNLYMFLPIFRLEYEERNAYLGSLPGVG